MPKLYPMICVKDDCPYMVRIRLIAMWNEWGISPEKQARWYYKLYGEYMFKVKVGWLYNPFEQSAIVNEADK